jgi:phospholipid/cholesterol/gamma-HCH transport system permease protein
LIKLLRVVADIGSLVLIFLNFLGSKVIFIILGLFGIFLRPFYYKIFFKQFIEIAFFSLPIVGLTALFTGMVLALQSYVGFARFSAEGAIANVVAISIARELGPVLTALMVAGRIAASMAAEIGTMKVGEQIDALYTVNVNPIKYLITPRLIAGVLALPILVFIADIIGISGGYLVAVYQLGFSSSDYINATINILSFWDIVSGLIKAAVFGLIITSMGTFYGYNSKEGAVGVGKATTNAVVIASLLIFLSDYLLTLIFFSN